MLKSQVQLLMEKGTKAVRLRSFRGNFTAIETKYVQVVILAFVENC